MPFWEIFLLSVGLGADAFSVAIAVGVCWCGPRQIFRLAFHFGLFQFFMPLLGWAIGGAMTGFLGPISRWIAAAILAFISLRMLYNVFKNESDAPEAACDPTTGWSLIGLSLATSIDALGAGFGFGLMASGLLFACIIIGITAALMTIGGMLLAGRLSSIFGKRVEAVGAAVLMILAIKIAFGG